MLWLKVKAISRKHLLDGFGVSAKISLQSSRVADKFSELFSVLSADVEKSHLLLNAYIKSAAFVMDAAAEEGIASELHKLRYFSWGGDYANALDKFLVDRYVKKYGEYGEISRKLETEIPAAVNGYVMCSWYNHWSTILIENIFKRHAKVLPAIGNIKRVDFFIDDTPFDLKTTYLPSNFIDTRRKEAGLRTESSELLSAARAHGVQFDKDAKPKDVLYEISEKLKIGGGQGERALGEVIKFRKQVAEDCIRNPAPLIQNLYEQQGAMRFDAANRLYVVLMDTDNFENSWKLKRNPNLLRAGINSYLDGFSKESARNITFSHPAKSGEFTVLSDIIFIVARTREQ